MIEELFDLDKTILKNEFLKVNYPWELLIDLKSMIINIGKNLNKEDYQEIKENVWVGRNVKISSSAEINGPCIIGNDTEIRVNAFIRGSVIIGNNCVIGNSTEIKNAILFDNVKVPHFNYVGDSILGYKAHFGAGVITSNVKSDESNVVVCYKDKKIKTNRKKVGAIVGDRVEVGCNAVLAPGTIINKNSNIYPLTLVRGYIPQNVIVKDLNNIVEKK
ncbi:MAG: UDP-N-acetylglucosamine pyrophosphorylase [Bacilli bacterium]|nr:UDP-N-acetylglucosamine pyrophosphorylase [Bacilli bacterium]